MKTTTPDKKIITNLPINYMIYYKYVFLLFPYIYHIWRTKNHSYIICKHGNAIRNNLCSNAENPPHVPLLLPMVYIYHLVYDADQQSCTVVVLHNKIMIKMGRAKPWLWIPTIYAFKMHRFPEGRRCGIVHIVSSHGCKTMMCPSRQW